MSGARRLLYATPAARSQAEAIGLFDDGCCPVCGWKLGRPSELDGWCRCVDIEVMVRDGVVWWRRYRPPVAAGERPRA